MCENWTDYLTMDELNFYPENQIKIWLTNIIFYGIEDLLNGKELK